jgi:hypothetical protein
MKFRRSYGNILKNYFSKLEKEVEIGKFLDTYDPPKLNQEDISNLNRSITSNEIKTVKRILPTKKSPGPDGFMAEFYQTFKGELTPVFNKQKEGILPNFFYETSITLVLKPCKDASKKVIG